MAEIIREVISVGYVVENGARRPLTDDESRKFARGLNEAFAATREQLETQVKRPNPRRWYVPMAGLLLLVMSGCTPYADRVANTCARMGAPMGSQHYWSCVRMQVATDQRDREMWGGIGVAGVALARPVPRTVVVGGY